ncbi:MAG: VCBS repeat-containing protein, partial [Calditrichaeota bacterium]
MQIRWLNAILIACSLYLFDRTPVLAQSPAPIAHNGFVQYDSLAGGPAQGVSLVDYDRDGRLDLFLAAPEGRHRLLRNLGGLIFADVTQETALDQAAAGTIGVWADVNNDGRTDLFVAGTKSCQLFLADEQGRFQDMSSMANGFGEQYVMAALWSDVNRDGFLDLYLACFDA